MPACNSDLHRIHNTDVTQVHVYQTEFPGKVFSHEIVGLYGILFVHFHFTK